MKLIHLFCITFFLVSCVICPGMSQHPSHDRELKKKSKLKLKKSNKSQKTGKAKKKDRKGKKAKKKKVKTKKKNKSVKIPLTRPPKFGISSITLDPLPPSLENGLPKVNIERAVKVAAASYLTKALTGPDFAIDADGVVSLQSIDIMREQFSSDAIYKLYSENRTIGVDDALLVKDGGQCFVTFQATTKESLDDILDNFDRRVQELCNADGECCPFRKGYADAWNNEFKDELLADTKECVESCDANSEEPCLLIGGHSQGGSIANAAFMDLKDLTSNYESYTFGAPPSLMVEPENCPPFEPNKFFRFGKGLYKGFGGGIAGVNFDLVPFVSEFLGIIGADEAYAVGPFLILSSEDSSNVAYIGMNSDHIILQPFDIEGGLGIAHNLYNDAESSDYPGTGYFNLLKRMRDEANAFPVPTNGYDNGYHCTSRTETQADLLCMSGRCDRATLELHPTCKRILESGERCNDDDDCRSGRCIEISFFRDECE